MATTRVLLNNKEIDDLLNSPSGPVVKHLMVVGNRVRNRSREIAGKVTHDLERSIVTRQVREGTGAAVLIGVFSGRALPYALHHHEGTRPHVIRPRRAPFLVFFWPKAGRVMYLRKVNHPGTRPNPYLKQALQEVQRGR